MVVVLGLLGVLLGIGWFSETPDRGDVYCDRANDGVIPA
jgi:hypothetical protein